MVTFVKLRLIPEKRYVRMRHHKLVGTWPNLDAPQTFNEKLCWLKLYDRTALHTTCADKYAVRAHVANKIGEKYLIPLYYHTENPEDIKADNLPDTPCIIKTNHDSGGGIFVHDKKLLNWEDIRAKLGTRLKSSHYYQTKEWQYKNIKPLIIVEQLLMDEDGNIPPDFKFHVCNGKLAFIQLDLDRSTDHKRNIYDSDWKPLDCRYIYENGTEVEKPEKLDEMIGLAETIAADFPFARVDFYFVGGDIYFGEITFHPESGIGRFIPMEWDHKFGKLLQLPGLKS